MLLVKIQYSEEELGYRNLRSFNKCKLWR